MNLSRSLFSIIILICNNRNGRVLFYSQAEIDHHQAWPSKAGKLIHEPVYISIDKDVLRKQDAITDWSNGDMTLMQLQAVLRIIYAHEKVIGIDITGECSATLDYFSELEDAEINNEANEELLRGCVISLNNSWRITVDHRMHNSCCAAEDTDCLNNISYLFQQHILSLPTTYPISSNNKKRVNHKLMTHPLSLLKRKIEKYGLARRVLPPLLPSLSRIDR